MKCTKCNVNMAFQGLNMFGAKTYKCPKCKKVSYEAPPQPTKIESDGDTTSKKPPDKKPFWKFW